MRHKAHRKIGYRFRSNLFGNQKKSWILFSVSSSYSHLPSYSFKICLYGFSCHEVFYLLSVIRLWASVNIIAVVTHFIVLKTIRKGCFQIFLFNSSSKFMITHLSPFASAWGNKFFNSTFKISFISNRNRWHKIFNIAITSYCKRENRLLSQIFVSVVMCHMIISTGE